MFNVEISRDGKNWQRKYRFETPKSFQYPTFHEHNGAIWLAVTQGENDASRKERIMFGKLEEVGQFESQSGKTRIVWPALAAEPAVMKVGVTLFTDRDYTLTEAPNFLIGRSFVHTSIEGYELVCTKPGEIFVMTLSKPHESNRGEALRKLGFVQVETPVFQLFPGEINRVSTWHRQLNPGERIALKKLAFPVLGEGLEVQVVQTVGSKQETVEEAAARIAEMEKVADHALVPPVLNTSPLPEYDYDRFDYGMTIGIERTPGGRLWACWVAGGRQPEGVLCAGHSRRRRRDLVEAAAGRRLASKDLPRERSMLVGQSLDRSAGPAVADLRSVDGHVRRSRRRLGDRSARTRMRTSRRGPLRAASGTASR